MVSLIRNHRFDDYGVKEIRMTASVDNSSYRNIPEPGQLVEVRCRQWVVANADSSKLGSVH